MLESRLADQQSSASLLPMPIRSRMHRWVVALVFLASGHVALTAGEFGHQLAEPLAVANGRLVGVAGRNRGITVFKGIPFAAPPVGALRWRSPQRAEPWSGLRVADAFSPSCP